MKYYFYFLFTICCFSLSAQIDLEDGLVVYYDFNGDVLDKGPNGIDPIDSMNISYMPDCEGNEEHALSLVDLDAYVSIPSDESYNFSPNEAFALSFWLLPDPMQLDINGSVGDVISKWTGQTSDGYPFTIRVFNQTHAEDGKISAAIFDTNGAVCGNNAAWKSETRINDGKWHNVVFQRHEDNLVELYVDGILEVSFEDVAICETANSFPMILGRRHLFSQDGRVYTGGLDELRIYNRILNADEIEFIKNKLVSPTEKVDNVDVTIDFFPNPSSSQIVNLRTDLPKVDLSFEVFDLHGHLVKRVSADEFVLEKWERGLFFIKSYYKEAFIETSKLVIL